MLSGGGEDCLHNVQEIDLSWRDLKAGVTHLGNWHVLAVCVVYCTKTDKAGCFQTVKISNYGGLNLQQVRDMHN